ncbi:MAG: DUF2203 domain-containing protein, partial [Candidatus Omnitrophica bacterium]|nr:DUF2203 domain-containing protein [Candidatus Omnitrophota bacterium]
FTLEEANRLLVKIVPLVQQLQSLQVSITTTNQQLDEAVRKLSEGNGYPIQELQQQIEELTQHQLNLIEAFQSALQQVEGFGCFLKDLNQGLVDFYSLRDDEPIFLCWRLGEDQVRFWHRVEDGFAGRQPIA